MARNLAVRIIVKKRAGGHCEICNVRFTDKPYRPKSPSLHHIFMQCHGGTDSVGNLIHICISCHRDIHADMEFAFSMGWIRAYEADDQEIWLKDGWVCLSPSGRYLTPARERVS